MAPVLRPTSLDVRPTCPDEAIAELAGVQHGVVSNRQLRASGLSAEAVRHRLRTGRIHVIHRLVYAVGHTSLTQRGRWMAAVLAAGPRAVLSHESAAALWRLMPAPSGDIHVTVRGSSRSRALQGLVVHRSTTRDARSTTIHHAILVTDPARTVVDLGGRRPRRQVERALDEAYVLELVDEPTLRRALGTVNGRKGRR